MRSSSLTSLVSSLAAAALAIAPFSVASAAPDSGEEAAEAAPEGDTAEAAPEGEAPEGETPEAAEAETPEGENPEGENPEEVVAEGEGEGEEAEGETPEEAAAEEGEGEEAEGETPEEVATEGEGEETEEASAEVTTPSYMPEEDDRPPEPRIANKPATGKGLMIAGGVGAGIGVAMTITFALMTRNCSFEGPLQCRLQNQDDFLIPMGAAALLTGTMLLSVGVGYHFKYKKWKRWSPEDDKRASLVPVPTALRGGGGLAWSGRF